MANDRMLFGPSGNSESFYAQGHKHSAEAPAWLKSLGLEAFEYSFGRGVNLSQATAAQIGAEARNHGIALSVHAPYYINFASDDAQTRMKSREYLLESAKAAEEMGATRVVFHAGACQGKDREEALRIASRELEAVIRALADAGADHVTLCPETMGKPAQLGTVEEVLELCSINPSVFLPALDMGHINAIGQGSLKTKQDFERIFDRVEDVLGYKAAMRAHIHFSKIEYGKSGEIKHLTLEDQTYGPEFAPLAHVLAERGCHGVVICESKDVMAEDALKLKQIYQSLVEKQR